MKVFTLRRLVVASAMFVGIGIVLPLFIYDKVIVPLFLHSKIVSPLHLKSLVGFEFELFRFGPFVILLPAGLHSLVLISCLITGASLAAHVFARAKMMYIEAMRRELMELIGSVGAMVRSKVPLLTALEQVSDLIGEPLRSAIKEFVSLVRLGEDPHRAAKNVFAGTPSEVRLLASSLVIAMLSGGRVTEVLNEASKYVAQLQRMDYMRQLRLSEHKLIAIMAVFAFAFSGLVVVILVQYIARRLVSLPGVSSINVSFVLSSYFLSALIMDIIASLVVSRLVSGTFYLTPKYIALTTPFIAAIFAIAYLRHIIPFPFP